MNDTSEIARLLGRIESGDGEAAAELFPLVYEELKRLAKSKLNAERIDHTLQPTALVNEVYLRLVGGNTEIRFRSRRSFFSAAAEAMRHILVDAARRKLAQKRGGGNGRADVDVDRMLIRRPEELLGIHHALDALGEHDPPCAELVKLHYFGGYSLAEIADLMQISRSTANRWWTYSKAWLKTFIEAQA